MNRKQIAAIFLVCAVILAAGAYVLLSNSEPGPVLRQTVATPTEPPAKAPAWVESGQTPKPDYSPATAAEHNATPQSPATPPKTAVIEIKEDRIVTFTFVESLADFFLTRFVPESEQGKPVTLVSAKAINMYFGRELDGFATTGNDIRAMRKTVLDYVFTSATIATLATAYSPLFMEQIVDSALNDEREYSSAGVKKNRTLSPGETAAMLRLNAQLLEQTAAVFKIIANDPELIDMAAKYLRASKAVKRANGQLQNAIAEQGGTKQAGQRYKQAILQRESIKAAIVSRIRKSCKNCPSSDVFYLTQWAYRRTLGESKDKLAAFDMAADVMDTLASQFLEKSTELEKQ